MILTSGAIERQVYVLGSNQWEAAPLLTDFASVNSVSAHALQHLLLWYGAAQLAAPWRLHGEG